MQKIWTDSEYQSTHKNDIAELLINIPPSPCEVHSCPNYDRCNDEKLACQAFQQFVKVGSAGNGDPDMMQPNRKIFDILFPNDDGSMSE